MKVLRESKQVDEIDDWSEKYTLVDNSGDAIVKYAYSTNVYPDAILSEHPFRSIAENLIKLGYHLFNDDVREWENSIDESWFMQHELKELELPKPEHANLLHIGWMVMDSSYSGFSCFCQRPKDWDIILKSAIPFLCPLCKKKKERWIGISSYLEDFLVKDGFSIDYEWMAGWVQGLMKYDINFVKDTFENLLDKAFFNPKKAKKTRALVREAILDEQVEEVMKMFEKEFGRSFS